MEAVAILIVGGLLITMLDNRLTHVVNELKKLHRKD